MKRPARFIRPLGAPRLSARDQALADWRGLNPAALEKTKLKSKPVSEILSKVLPGLRLDQRRAEAELVRVWKDLLPPDIVAHAHPAGLRKGTLFVIVDSNVWMHDIIRYRQKEILERLQHSFGRQTVTKLSFRLG
jgi:predicted nucleic acid-binding Zn ribbon protein